MKLTLPLSTRGYGQNWVDCSPAVTSQNPAPRNFSAVAPGPGQLLYWGGGHRAYPANDAEIFDFATHRWTQQYAPECLDRCCRVCATNSSAQCSTSADCGGGTCNEPITTCTGTTPCNVPMCSCFIAAGGGSTELTAHGRPFVEETFQAYAYNQNPAHQHYLLALLGGTWSYSPPSTWTKLMDWANYPSLATSPWEFGKVLEYDPNVSCGADTGAILGFFPSGPQAGIYCFNYTTNRWLLFDSSFPAAWAGAQTDLYCTYDANQNQHVCSHFQRGVWAYHSATKTWTSLNSPAAVLGANTLAHDTAHNITLVALPNGAAVDLWYYDHTSSSWYNIDDTQLGSPRPSGANVARWNPFVYDSVADSFYFLSVSGLGGEGTAGIPDVDTSTWQYRFSSPPLVPTGTPTP